MTLTELIEKLQEIQLEGYGENKVVIVCYNEEFEPKPIIAANGDILL